MHGLMRSLMPNKDGWRRSLYVACRFVSALEDTHIYISMDMYIERDGHIQILCRVLCGHRSLMHVLCRALCGLMRSFHRLKGPNDCQNHARNQPEFRQRLMQSVMRGLRRIRLFKIRASEFRSHAP